MSYYLKKFWRINLVVVIMQALALSAQVCCSLIQMQTAQGVIERDFRRVLFWMAVALGGWLVFILFNSLGGFFQSRAVRAMNNAVRHDLAAVLLRKSHREYHAQDRGEYLSWFTNGVNQMETAWRSVFSFTAFTIQVAASIVALAFLHWSLIVVALLATLVMIAVPKLFAKKVERLGETCAQEEAAAVSKLKDALGGYDVLRFFGRGSRFSGSVDQASDQIEQPQYRKSYQITFITNGINIFNIVMQLLSNGYICFLSIQGTIIQSALFGSGSLIGNVTGGLQQLASLRMYFSAARPYFARITVHDSEKAPERPQGPEPVQESISVENLDFAYGEKKVLADLSATFEKGKKYALTGPSGCGKSTLLKLILGWLPDYEGTIRFDGRDAKNYTPEQLQQQMSYIAQDVFLFNTTIRDNITLGEDFTDEEMEKALRDSALAGDIVNMPLGLDTPVGEEGSSLSGGQRQRVAIARALIHNRSILLVDEGTSALDQKNASIVEESLLANPDLTLLLVSHHLTPERREQFDRVYELKQAA